MSIEIAVYAVLAGLTTLLVWRHWKSAHQNQSESRELLARAEEQGLTEPVSLHPRIDSSSCISVGACVAACPEGGVLGIINGTASLVSPSKCIGHGACLEACPVDAISLVFGTESRGVEIPHVSETFETNVPGMYIAGELGGMGLIRNAVTQGREAVEYIAKKGNSAVEGVYDLVVVGAGPAGLAATLQAEKEGLSYITIEQDDIGGAAQSYPRQKVVMTQPMEIPLYGKCDFRQISKEDLLELWDEVTTSADVSVRTQEKLLGVEQRSEIFTVTTSKGEYQTRHILLAIGRRGTPRKLGVPGEISSKVAYKLIDPEQYRDQKILIVGGGNSAAEAALALAAVEGTTVDVSCRNDVMAQTNEENRQKLREAEERGELKIYYEANVVEISQERIVLEQRGANVELDNDSVLVFIGGELPTAFLRKLGVEVDMKYGQR